ncbi:unnamed protein product, partial [Polarella glacialis]
VQLFAPPWPLCEGYVEETRAGYLRSAAGCLASSGSVALCIFMAVQGQGWESEVATKNWSEEGGDQRCPATEESMGMLEFVTFFANCDAIFQLRGLYC